MQIGKLMKIARKGSGVGVEEILVMLEGMGVQAKLEPLPSSVVPQVDELQREIAAGIAAGGRMLVLRISDGNGEMVGLLMVKSNEKKNG